MIATTIHKSSIFPSHSIISHRVLIRLENALLHQLFRLRPSLQVLLQTVRAHVLLQLLLLLLQSRRRRAVGQDVAFDQLILLRPAGETLKDVCQLVMRQRS